MTVRRVLLDGSFIEALLDDRHPSHGAAVSTYASLIDRYQAGTDRLFALSTVLDMCRPDARRDALGPIETTWVGREHLVAVRGVAASSPDVAMTLLILRREKFGAIATALHDFDQFDIEVLGVAPDTVEDTPAADRKPDGYVSYVSSETGPTPARRSTGG